METLQVVSFTVDRLMSKSNFRHELGSAGTWRRFREWDRAVQLAARLVRPETWPAPATWGGWEFGVGVCVPAGSRLDVGNTGKSLLDALEGVLYENDRQVRVFLSHREPVVVATVTVSALPAPARTSELWAPLLRGPGT